MVIGVLFSMLGIGLLIGLMFQMAIFALPLFAGVTAGRFAYDTGAGALGAILVGAATAVAALGLAQVILVVTRSTALRLMIAVAFAAPAGLAGYYLVLGFSHIGGAHGVWQPIFASIGAVMVAGAAVGRLATPVIAPRTTLRPT